jgi:uncharacterized protein
MHIAMRTVLLLLLATAGGALFALLHVPLPWTLGAMAAAGAWAVFRGEGRLPELITRGVRPVIGLLAGSAMSPSAVATLPRLWPVLAMVIAYTLATTVIGYFFYRRIWRYDPATALFSSAPGGLAELTLFGGTVGADLPTLVLSHATRVIIVVSALPFILQYGLGIEIFAPSLSADPVSGSVGEWLVLAACGLAAYWVGRWIDLPGGVIIPAIVLSAVAFGTGTVSLTPPGWLLIVVQVVVGTAAGVRLVGVTRRRMAGAVWGAAVWTLVLITVAGLSALLASAIVDQPASTLVLAFSPGGLPEIVVIAYTVGLDVAAIVLCQVVRIFAVHLSAPLIFRYLNRRQGPV